MVVCVVVAVLLVVDVSLVLAVPFVAPDVALVAVSPDAVVAGVAAVADAVDVVEGAEEPALAAVTFESATVVVPLWCSANAPPVPRKRSMLSAPVTRRAPRAGCARRVVTFGRVVMARLWG